MQVCLYNIYINRKHLVAALPILKAAFLSLIPLVLVLSGSFFIALGSELFMEPLVKAYDFPYELPSPNYAFLGFLLIVLGFLLTFYLIRKNKLIAAFGWIIALATQGIIVVFILTLVISPWFDILILNFSFNKGACKTLDYLINSRTDQEYKEKALKQLDVFCQSAGEMFGGRNYR